MPWQSEPRTAAKPAGRLPASKGQPNTAWAPIPRWPVAEAAAELLTLANPSRPTILFAMRNRRTGPWTIVMLAFVGQPSLGIQC